MLGELGRNAIISDSLSIVKGRTEDKLNCRNIYKIRKKGLLTACTEAKKTPIQKITSESL